MGHKDRLYANIHFYEKNKKQHLASFPNQETQPFGAMFRQHAFQTDWYENKRYVRLFWAVHGTFQSS